MKIASGKPVVGATLVVARPRRQPIFISLYGLHKAIVIPNAERSEESKVHPYMASTPSDSDQSMTARPDIQYHGDIVTKSENSVRTLFVGLT